METTVLKTPEEVKAFLSAQNMRAIITLFVGTDGTIQSHVQGPNLSEEDARHWGNSAAAGIFEILKAETGMCTCYKCTEARELAARAISGNTSTTAQA